MNKSDRDNFCAAGVNFFSSYLNSVEGADTTDDKCALYYGDNNCALKLLKFGVRMGDSEGKCNVPGISPRVDISELKPSIQKFITRVRKQTV